MSSGRWKEAADVGADIGRTLAHGHGWVVRTEGVDDMSDQEVRDEAVLLERESERWVCLPYSKLILKLHLCRYFNTWRDPEAELEDRAAAASRCGDLCSRLLALIIGSRGLLPLSTLSRLIRVS